MDKTNTAASAKDAQSGKPRLGPWLLAKVRKWHGWLGLAMSLFITVVCLSGIFLNHKDLFNRWLRPRSEQASPQQYASLWNRALATDARLDAPQPIAFSEKMSTTMAATPLQTGLAQALRAARDRWGETGLEKIELKAERGTVMCKLTSNAKEQLWFDLGSGESSAGSQTRKPVKVEGGGKSAKAENWGKWIENLHTGKIGGLTGKLVVDFTSLSILALTLTGLYLWAWPRLRPRNP